MVCRDLRGNNEPSGKWNPARRGRLGARGALAPRGKSGLILSGERSTNALYLRGHLHASWGIQLGDTVSPSVSPCVSPSVSPCVSPRCQASDGRIGHHVGPHAVCGYRMWWCLSGAPTASMSAFAGCGHAALHALVCGGPQIGIGGSLAAPPLPHHRAYGSVHGGSKLR